MRANRVNLSSLSALLLAGVLSLAQQASAQGQYQAEVVRILDGDTVEVLTASRNTKRVRLANIDAPERRQAFGEKSRQALAAMAFRQTVTVVDQGGDRYGRVIGVLMKDGRDLNAEMVKQGMAWVYTRYNNNPALPALERQARAARVGLWADHAPVAPWEFRRAR